MLARQVVCYFLFSPSYNYGLAPHLAKLNKLQQICMFKKYTLALVMPDDMNIKTKKLFLNNALWFNQNDENREILRLFKDNIICKGTGNQIRLLSTCGIKFYKLHHEINYKTWV